MLTYLILASVFIVVFAFLHVFLFIFTHGSTPGKDKGQDSFIDKTCAPSGLLRTVLTFGYLKATWRRFCIYYRLILFPQSKG